MQETIQQLETLLEQAKQYIQVQTEEQLRHKIRPEKWSKKEILGHLIDSAINNLQRYTEISFSDQPYLLRGYNQDALVQSNDYQHADTQDILQLWWFLNKRIQFMMQQQSEESLRLQITLLDGSIQDLGFLMADYVRHMEHHLHQIMEEG